MRGASAQLVKPYTTAYRTEQDPTMDTTRPGSPCMTQKQWHHSHLCLVRRLQHGGDTRDPGHGKQLVMPLSPVGTRDAELGTRNSEQRRDADA